MSTFSNSASRRRFLASCGAAAGSVGLVGLGTHPSHAWAQFRVEIGGVGATQLPIAVARFKGEDSAPQPVGAIVMADLERSGFFRRIEALQVVEETGLPPMSDWRGRGADALVGGSMTRLADGRFDVRYRLWDVVKAADLGGGSEAVVAADLRLVAHRIADNIYERLTGEKGVFSTRICYVTRQGRNFQLRIADADGEGAQVALNSNEPIISPAWAPGGKEIAYVSFESQKAVVWIQQVATGARRMVANFRGSNSAPAWSPDGSRLAMTLSQEGGSQLFSLNRDGSGLKRLTQSSAIDTEPAYSPDGRLLYFVSDRGGSPQVYRMNAEGGPAERVTFNSAQSLSPAISPDGRLLAYISRQGGAYRLVVQPLDGSGPATAITESTDDQSPSFAPNGKLIVYNTRAAGRELLMTTTLDGKIKARLASSGADIREPDWGPFGR
ncbi:MAG: Tol-Pal system beta propeller repeat protein TolB [Betaproteobacteria bacterium]